MYAVPCGPSDTGTLRNTVCEGLSGWRGVREAGCERCSRWCGMNTAGASDAHLVVHLRLSVVFTLHVFESDVEDPRVPDRVLGGPERVAER